MNLNSIVINLLDFGLRRTFKKKYQNSGIVVNLLDFGLRRTFKKKHT